MAGAATEDGKCRIKKSEIKLIGEKQMRKELLIYDPRKILEFIEGMGRVASADLEKLGYDHNGSIVILTTLSDRGYIKECGRKIVKQPVIYEGKDGKRKVAAPGRSQNAFVLTRRGKYEKPEPGSMEMISGIMFKGEEVEEAYSQLTPEKREELNKMMDETFNKVLEDLKSRRKNRKK